MLECMAAARFHRTPAEFARLDPGERVLCLHVDRVMRAMEMRQLEITLRNGLAGSVRL